MTRVLQLNSSIFADDGQSTRLADAYVARLRREDPATEVRRRDLAADPVPHLTARRFTALATPEAERTPGQRAIAAESDALVAELEWADELVLGVPMYNFSVPSQLKAWFDHVARAGVTFRYTESGPVGLLAGRRARVFTTRGGVYGRDSDLETPYVRQFLGLLGITDVEVVCAQGLAMGEQQRDAALAEAERGLDRLAAAA